MSTRDTASILKKFCYRHTTRCQNDQWMAYLFTTRCWSLWQPLNSIYV